MSLASIIDRYENAHINIANAIENAEGNISPDDGFEEFADDINSIVPIASLIDGTVVSVTASRATKIKARAFESCTALEYVNLPNASEIGASAFSNCSSLKELHLNGIESIGVSNGPLANISTLEILEMQNLTSAVDYAFQSCNNIIEASLPNLSNLLAHVLRKVNLTSVNLENCKSIAGGAFTGCKFLSYLDLPNVTFIGNNAFANCTSLAELHLPALLSIGSSTWASYTATEEIYLDNLLSLPYAFSNRTSLRIFYAPKIQDIVTQGLRSCTSLEELDFPELSRVTQSCFIDCKGVSRVNMPKVKLVGTNAFLYCIGITELDFPICSMFSGRAFDGCSNLSSFRVSGSMATFNVNTFQSCINLYDLWLDTETYCSIASTSGAFPNTPMAAKTGRIHVPASLYEGYLTSARWSSMSACFVGDIIRDDEDLTE